MLSTCLAQLLWFCAMGIQFGRLELLNPKFFSKLLAYLCRSICWGRPLFLGLGIHATKNFLGFLLLCIWLSFSNHFALLSSIICVIVREFAIFSLIFELWIFLSLTSKIVILSILLKHLWWQTSNLLRSFSFRAQLSHPQSRRLITIASYVFSLSNFGIFLFRSTFLFSE